MPQTMSRAPFSTRQPPESPPGRQLIAEYSDFLARGIAKTHRSPDFLTGARAQTLAPNTGFRQIPRTHFLPVGNLMRKPSHSFLPVGNCIRIFLTLTMWLL